MSIVSFLRIFWARRMIVLVAVIASLIGAYVVLLIVQPRYEATARVLMNITRPDPVTGDSMTSKTASAYFDSQMELIHDYRVTGRVVDKFGWLSDPVKIAAYQAKPPSDTRDFRRWLSQQVSDSMESRIAGTALEVTFKAPTPAMASFGADSIREAYLIESLQSRREQAAKDAAWYTTQAIASRQAAETAENTKAAYERETGIIMQGRDSDLDSDRLSAIAGQATVGSMMSAAQPANSGSALQLAQIDAVLAEASQRLGPNHPEMQALKTRRSLVAQVVAEEQSAAKAAASGQNVASIITKALQDQKSRVIGQRDKVERLRQLQSEVDLRRDQYRSAASRAAQYSLEAAISDVGLTPLGVVITPQKPVFPNKTLIMGGAGALGIGMGLALALLLELLNRRVRGVEDLDLLGEIHCVGVFERLGSGRRKVLRRMLRNLRAPRLKKATA